MQIKMRGVRVIYRKADKSKPRNSPQGFAPTVPTVPLNQWKHVAARYDGSEVRGFINGTIDSATTAATGALTATTAPLWIGGDTTHLNGTLDDVSIFDYALSDAEITNLTNNRSGRYEYHHQNALGSNIVLTDGKKNVLARYEYDVFGAVRSETGTSDNVRKFTGKEYDADVKLYYYSARYYDPYIGRFTSRDPAKDGVNWYAYVANNPLKFIDPTGLRKVNGIELYALKYTFGEWIANYLADEIDIELTTLPSGIAGRVTSSTQILLKSSYDLYQKDRTKALKDLSVFIHEATHIWQRHTNLHRGGTGGQNYQYTVQELHSLDLQIEQHAEAVQNWFFVSFGLHSEAITNAWDGWNHLYQNNLYIKGLVDDAVNKKQQNSLNWTSLLNLQLQVDQDYANVLNQIRNPMNIIRGPYFWW